MFNKSYIEKRLLKTSGADYTNAVGGLPWTASIRSIDTTHWLAPLQKLMVYSGFLFHQKLDYIFSRGIEIMKTERIDLEGSDHYPIMMKFALT